MAILTCNAWLGLVTVLTPGQCTPCLLRQQMHADFTTKTIIKMHHFCWQGHDFPELAVKIGASTGEYYAIVVARPDYDVWSIFHSQHSRNFGLSHVDSGAGWVSGMGAPCSFRKYPWAY